MITIKHRFTNTTLYEFDVETIKQALELGLKSNADLSYTDLSYTNLSYTDLRDTDLSYTNLSYTNLSNADLRDADLSYTDLRDADLRGANLRDADLRGANLRDADLSDADLRDADLSDTDLNGEKLTKTPIFISNLIWEVTITTTNLTIGCQTHSHEIWKNFTEQEINDMESRALDFWKQWKEPLLMMCKTHAV